MSELSPFAVLHEAAGGREIALPAALARLYGELRLPSPRGRPYVIANFVTSLDGVVALGGDTPSGGGEISGFNRHDAALMGILRALADAVVVGAGTLRSVPQHFWTAQYIYPPLASAYQELRSALGKDPTPLNVIVTARGTVDLSLPVFRSGEVPVLLVTTAAGAERLAGNDLPAWITVAVAGGGTELGAGAIIEAVRSVRPSATILVEGGPHLMASFFGENRLDELFLTLSPQVAGRDGSVERPGLVAGRLFGPAAPLWGDLVSVRQAGSHLFLRYAFTR